MGVSANPAKGGNTMNAVVERPWVGLIQKAEPHFTEIAEKTGNLVNFKREAMFALQTINGSEYLQKCSPESVFNALINVASVGLTLSPAEKLAYLVPRKGVCCLDISYRGMVKIATDSGGVAAVTAEIVREADEFEWFDKFTRPRHRFDPFAPAEQRGDIRGVYCMAVLSSGITQVEALSMQEITKIRTKSKAKDGPWFDWPEEMMKKSVVRRASKMWPHSERMQEAMTILDQHQGLDPDDQGGAQQEVEQPRAREEKPAAKTPSVQDVMTGAPAGTRPGPDAVVHAPLSDGGPAEDGPREPTKAPEPRPMQAGQIRIILAKMKQHSLNNTDFEAKWGRPLTNDDGAPNFNFGDYDKIVDWISRR